MLKVLVNVVLSERVLDIIGFLVILPVLVQLVDFARDVPLFLGIKSLKKEIVIVMSLSYDICKILLCEPLRSRLCQEA